MSATISDVPKISAADSRPLIVELLRGVCGICSSAQKTSVQQWLNRKKKCRAVTSLASHLVTVLGFPRRFPYSAGFAPSTT